MNLILITLGVFLAFFMLVHIAMYLKNVSQKEQLIKILRSHMQSSLLEASVEASEREKQRIARNLHDEINPMITVLKRSLELHSIQDAKNEKRVHTYENECAMIDDIAESLRKISYELTPSFIERYGLLRALEDYLRNLSEAGILITDLSIESTAAGRTELLQAAELNVYRMCLELIQNVIKHSCSTHLQMRVNKTENGIEIHIQHNGKGLTNDEAEKLIDQGKGLGLRSLKARALILSASLNYTKNNDHSFIRIHIPTHI